MNRAPAVALLVGGCALAAAAASTGPYLSERPVPPAPFLDLAEEAARERQRRRLLLPVEYRETPSWELALEWLLLLVVGVAVLYVIWRGARPFARLVRRHLAGSPRTVGSTPYDPGEESADDAPTALRRRVAGELAALSADLDTAADAREVVIACYARMERALAAAGSARRPDESPLELLARVLAEQDVPEGDVRRLTALFTEARFSAHPVTDEMRQAARRSLDGIAAALSVPA